MNVKSGNHNTSYFCPVCLSKGRNLYVLEDGLSDLTILLDIFNKETCKQAICWECYGNVRKIARFKHTALRAQKILQEKSFAEIQNISLSTLKKITQTEAITVTPNDVEQESEIKSSPPYQASCASPLTSQFSIPPEYTLTPSLPIPTSPPVQSLTPAEILIKPLLLPRSPSPPLSIPLPQPPQSLTVPEFPLQPQSLPLPDSTPPLQSMPSSSPESSLSPIPLLQPSSSSIKMNLRLAEIKKTDAAMPLYIMVEKLTTEKMPLPTLPSSFRKFCTSTRSNIKCVEFSAPKRLISNKTTLNVVRFYNESQKADKFELGKKSEHNHRKPTSATKKKKREETIIIHDSESSESNDSIDLETPLFLNYNDDSECENEEWLRGSDFDTGNVLKIIANDYVTDTPDDLETIEKREKQLHIKEKNTQETLTNHLDDNTNESSSKTTICNNLSDHVQKVETRNIVFDKSLILYDNVTSTDNIKIQNNHNMKKQANDKLEKNNKQTNKIEYVEKQDNIANNFPYILEMQREYVDKPDNVTDMVENNPIKEQEMVLLSKTIPVLCVNDGTISVVLGENFTNLDSNLICNSNNSTKNEQGTCNDHIIPNDNITGNKVQKYIEKDLGSQISKEIQVIENDTDSNTTPQIKAINDKMDHNQILDEKSIDNQILNEKQLIENNIQQNSICPIQVIRDKIGQDQLFVKNNIDIHVSNETEETENSIDLNKPCQVQLIQDNICLNQKFVSKNDTCVESLAGDTFTMEITKKSTENACQTVIKECNAKHQLYVTKVTADKLWKNDFSNIDSTQTSLKPTNSDVHATFNPWKALEIVVKDHSYMKNSKSWEFYASHKSKVFSKTISNCLKEEKQNLGEVSVLENDFIAKEVLSNDDFNSIDTCNNYSNADVMTDEDSYSAHDKISHISAPINLSDFFPVSNDTREHAVACDKHNIDNTNINIKVEHDTDAIKDHYDSHGLCEVKQEQIDMYDLHKAEETDSAPETDYLQNREHICNNLIDFSVENKSTAMKFDHHQSLVAKDNFPMLIENPPKVTNVNKDILHKSNIDMKTMLTDNLLQPVYCTDWVDETYNHNIANDNKNHFYNSRGKEVMDTKVINNRDKNLANRHTKIKKKRNTVPSKQTKYKLKKVGSLEKNILTKSNANFEMNSHFSNVYANLTTAYTEVKLNNMTSVSETEDLTEFLACKINESLGDLKGNSKCKDAEGNSLYQQNKEVGINEACDHVTNGGNKNNSEIMNLKVKNNSDKMPTLRSSRKNKRKRRRKLIGPRKKSRTQNKNLEKRSPSKRQMLCKRKHINNINDANIHKKTDYDELLLSFVEESKSNNFPNKKKMSIKSDLKMDTLQKNAIDLSVHPPVASNTSYKSNQKEITKISQELKHYIKPISKFEDAFHQFITITPNKPVKKSKKYKSKQYDVNKTGPLDFIKNHPEIILDELKESLDSGIFDKEKMITRSEADKQCETETANAETSEKNMTPIDFIENNRELTLADLQDELSCDDFDLTANKIKDIETNTEKVHSKVENTFHKERTITNEKQVIKDWYVEEYVDKTKAKELREKYKNDRYFINALYKCVMCVQVFYKKTDFTCHMQLHKKKAKGKTRFVCGVCSLEFAQNRTLMLHSRKHRRYYKCRWCDERYPSAFPLKYHAMKNHPLKFKSFQKFSYGCDVCGKWFCNNSALLVHKRTVHNIICSTKCILYSSKDNFCSTLDCSCLKENNFCTTENELCSTENNAYTTEKNASSMESIACATENDAFSNQDNLCFTEREWCLVENKYLCSIQSNVCPPENNSCSKENNICSTENSICSTENNMYSSENNICSTENNMFSTENNSCPPEKDWCLAGEHQRSNEDKEVLETDTAELSFGPAGHKAESTKIVDLKRRYICFVCNQRYADFELLLTHQTNTHAYSVQIKPHYYYRTSNYMRCFVCQIEYKKFGSLLSHQYRFH